MEREFPKENFIPYAAEQRVAAFQQDTMMLRPPKEALPGDLIVVAALFERNVFTPAPVGWTLLKESTTTDAHRSVIWFRVLQAGDPREIFVPGAIMFCGHVFRGKTLEQLKAGEAPEQEIPVVPEPRTREWWWARWRADGEWMAVEVWLQDGVPIYFQRTGVEFEDYVPDKDIELVCKIEPPDIGPPATE